MRAAVSLIRLLLEYPQEEKLSLLNEEWFQNQPLRKLFVFVRDFIQEHQTSPSLEVLRTRFSPPSTSPEEASIYSAYIESIVSQDVKITDLPFCIAEVEKGAKTSNLVNLQLKVSDLLKSGDTDAAEAEMLQYILHDPSQSKKEEREFDIASKEIISIAESRRKPIPKGYYVPSGFPAYDRRVGGWGKGELIVIGAPRKCGKSIFLLNTGYNAFCAGYNPVYFSLEVGREEWLDRLFSLVSAVSHDRVRLRTLNSRDEQLLRLSSLFLSCSPDRFLDIRNWADQNLEHFMNLSEEALIQEVFEKINVPPRENSYKCIDWPGIGIDEMMAKCHLLKSKNKCDLVIVDYLNIMNAGRYSNLSMWERLGKVAELLKLLARKINIPVIVAVQMKEDEKRVKYAPIVEDHADRVILWTRDEESILLREIKVELTRSRSTDVFDFTLSTDLEHMRMTGYNDGTTAAAF